MSKTREWTPSEKPRDKDIWTKGFDKSLTSSELANLLKSLNPKFKPRSPRKAPRGTNPAYLTPTQLTRELETMEARLRSMEEEFEKYRAITAARLIDLERAAGDPGSNRFWTRFWASR
jgi:hypothetical protein